MDRTEQRDGADRGCRKWVYNRTLDNNTTAQGTEDSNSSSSKGAYCRNKVHDSSNWDRAMDTTPLPAERQTPEAQRITKRSRTLNRSHSTFNSRRLPMLGIRRRIIRMLRVHRIPLRHSIISRLHTRHSRMEPMSIILKTVNLRLHRHIRALSAAAEVARVPGPIIRSVLRLYHSPASLTRKHGHTHNSPDRNVSCAQRVMRCRALQS